MDTFNTTVGFIVIFFVLLIGLTVPILAAGVTVYAIIAFATVYGALNASAACLIAGVILAAVLGVIAAQFLPEDTKSA